MNRKHKKEPRPAAVINNAGTVPTPLTDDEVKHITDVFNEVDDMQGMIADVNRRLKKLADLGIIAKMDQWTERRLRIERGETTGETPASFTDEELALITETFDEVKKLTLRVRNVKSQLIELEDTGVTERLGQLIKWGSANGIV